MKNICEKCLVAARHYICLIIVKGYPMANSINYGLAGVNSPLPHQIAIRNLLILLYNKVIKNNPVFDFAPEMDIQVCTEDKPYFNKNADVVIWEKSKSQIHKINEPLVIIEITNNPFPSNINETTDKNDIGKMLSYFQNFGSLKEAFLYNNLETNKNNAFIRFSRKTKRSVIVKERGKNKSNKLNIIFPTQILNLY